jgi:hypothetical protein
VGFWYLFPLGGCLGHQLSHFHGQDIGPILSVFLQVPPHPCCFPHHQRLCPKLGPNSIDQLPFLPELFSHRGGVEAFFGTFVGIEHNLSFSPVDFGIVLFQPWESYDDW